MTCMAWSSIFWRYCSSLPARVLKLTTSRRTDTGFELRAYIFLGLQILCCQLERILESIDARQERLSNLIHSNIVNVIPLQVNQNSVTIACYRRERCLHRQLSFLDDLSEDEPQILCQMVPNYGLVQIALCEYWTNREVALHKLQRLIIQCIARALKDMVFAHRFENCLCGEDVVRSRPELINESPAICNRHIAEWENRKSEDRIWILDEAESETRCVGIGDVTFSNA